MKSGNTWHQLCCWEQDPSTEKKTQIIINDNEIRNIVRSCIVGLCQEASAYSFFILLSQFTLSFTFYKLSNQHVPVCTATILQSYFVSEAKTQTKLFFYHILVFHLSYMLLIIFNIFSQFCMVPCRETCGSHQYDVISLRASHSKIWT